MRIRAATPDDAPALAQLHWDSWVATYAGIFPPATFAGFPLTAREALWRSTAQVAALAPTQRQQLLLAEAAGESAPPLGFACVGPLRANGACVPAPERGEVWALYLQPAVQRQGIGAALWQASCAWLREAGFAEVYVWVLKANTGAVAFYRSQGGVCVDARVFDADGTAIDELCFRANLGER